MLIIGMILFGLLVGAAAQLVLGRSRSGIDWTLALVAGVVGSFVGGLIVSLLAGDGLELRLSGIIGSIAGAIIVTAAWSWWKNRSASPVD
ncbi:GlsB/YeaQ/YmgE family stress response membrane protein [Rhodococcus sp. NPDC003318]|uniref:GlsB/YeaQ/YmgE family stress response membrane protein n=1 Tax=Rhodococcus sp. NPDC003318 TaxID=3364503 RepID=UPI0036BEC265